MLQKLGYIVMAAGILAYLALCIALSRKHTRDELHQTDLTRKSKQKSLWKPDQTLDQLPQASYI
jgi:hypothetical protein